MFTILLIGVAGIIALYALSRIIYYVSPPTVKNFFDDVADFMEDNELLLRIIFVVITVITLGFTSAGPGLVDLVVKIIHYK